MITEYVNGRIKNAYYNHIQTTTLRTLVLDNGYTVTGESACADPDDYGPDFGCELAYKHAVEKLVPLFGFLLSEKLFLEEKEKTMVTVSEQDCIRNTLKADILYLLDTLELDVEFYDHSLGEVSINAASYHITDQKFIEVSAEVQLPGVERVFCIAYTHMSLEVSLFFGPWRSLRPAISLKRSEPLKQDWLENAPREQLRATFEMVLKKGRIKLN